MLKTSNRPSEKIISLLFWIFALCVAAVFSFIIFDILSRGISGLHWSFLFEAPEHAGRSGGISSILVSTLLILLICMLVAIPIGVATAILLAEFMHANPRLGRWTRYSLDILAGVPSIIFGLFGSAFFCRALGMGFSILAGGLTLACMVLPLLIRSTEMGLRAVPVDDRLSGSALALSQSTLLFHILLPAAVPGIIVGLVLGIGRALAETAALLFTSGYVDRMPSSLFDSGRALSIHIYDLSMNVPGGDEAAYKSTIVILILILILNGVAMSLTQTYFGRKVLRA